MNQPTSSTVASFTQIEPDRVSILVMTEYVNSLYDFLVKKDIPASPPTVAVFKSGRVYIDACGRKHIETEAIDHEISVKGTIQDAEKWIEEWLTYARIGA